MRSICNTNLFVTFIYRAYTKLSMLLHRSNLSIVGNNFIKSCRIIMIEALKHINIISRGVLGIQKANTRYFSVSNMQNVFSKIFRGGPPKPPYNHICQVGDPVLRSKATPVDLKQLQTPEFEKVLDQLCKVMRRFKGVGLSAPQIGLSLQVFVIEVTEASLKETHPQIKEFYEMKPIPLTYFINPTMEIINPEKVTFVESCGSLIGYHAEVARAKEVQIKAFDRLGEPFHWRAKGWSARIVQHEFDHLNGILYVDKMNTSTFEFSYWEKLNELKGNIKVKYLI